MLNEDPQDEHDLEPHTIDLQPSEGLRAKSTLTQPKHFNYFVVNLPPLVDHASPALYQRSSTVHSLAKFVSYDKFTNAHIFFSCY